MRLLCLAGALTVMLNGAAVAEPDRESANYWMPYCHRAATGDFYQGDAFLNGYCAGLVNGLGVMGRSLGACVPDGVTPRQALRVVIQYIDQRPARTNENFKLLAFEAMRAAWPCRQ
jgi:hypothetical protein